MVRIEFQNGRLVGGRTDSQENRGWFAYRGAESANKNQIRQLYKQRKGNEAAIDAQVKAKENELAQTQHKFIRSNPGTYLAKFLTWKQPRFIGDKGTYLSDLDVMDNSLVRSMALPDRIESMMRTFSGGKDAGFLSCIDIVKASVEENPVVLEFVLYNMLDGFYNTGKETICQYILDNYIFDEDCGANLSDVIRQRAQGIINLRVGNYAAQLPHRRPRRKDGGAVRHHVVPQVHPRHVLGELVPQVRAGDSQPRADVPGNEPPRLRHGGHFRGPAEDGLDQGDRRQPDSVAKRQSAAGAGTRRSPTTTRSRRRPPISCWTRRAKS